MYALVKLNNLCWRSCHAKIRQGIARAADLTKLVNDLRGQFNQFTSTLTEIEIRPAAMEVPGAVTFADAQESAGQKERTM